VKSAARHSFSDNIYTRIGVRPLINARGTWTYLCGSLELPETREAAEEASHYFVDMFELQAAAGRHLAKLSGAESGMVTSGSAGAMASATAGCIAGTDPKNVWQLPDTTGLKSEIVMMGGRSAFDSAIRLAGGKLIIAKTVDDLQPAMTGSRAYSRSPSPQVFPCYSTTRLVFPPTRISRATQRSASIFFVSVAEKVCLARNVPGCCWAGRI